MKKNIPNIIVPIIKNGIDNLMSLDQELSNKKVVLFGVPGAFTPTCSEKHLPEFINSISAFRKIGFDDIYCLSVNDKHVMKAWLLSHSNSEQIIGIADGNAEITKKLNLLENKTSSYMGFRSSRFAMIVENNLIKEFFVEKPGKYEVSSPKNILSCIN